MEQTETFSIRSRIAHLQRLRERFERERDELRAVQPERAQAVTEAIKDLDVLIRRLRDEQRRSTY